MCLHFMCTFIFFTVNYTRIILGKHFEIHNILKKFIFLQDI
jgi:hypothetical protein